MLLLFRKLGLIIFLFPNGLIRYSAMEILAIIISSILGTAIMTGFSQVVESLTDNKFNEAHLLNRFLNYLNFTTKKIGDNYYLGWIIHFAIGVTMATILYCYYFYLSEGVFIWTGLFLGFILGIIGVAGWLILVSYHKNPPKINWRFFFVQLIVAHMIFGVTVTWVLARFVTNF